MATKRLRKKLLKFLLDERALRGTKICHDGRLPDIRSVRPEPGFRGREDGFGVEITFTSGGSLSTWMYWV